MKLSNLRILVVDDHTIFRKGLKEILLSHPEISLVDEASSGEETLRKIETCDYSCLLLDIHLPGRSGLDILKQVKALKPDLPILILSMYPEEQFGIRCLQAGASSYLTKRSSPEELKEAIFKACNAQTYVTPGLADRILSQLSGKASMPPHECLTDRELQVLIMIGSGKQVSQIARELSLSVKTVSTHRIHILQKMGLRNNAELTYYAIKNSLVF